MTVAAFRRDNASRFGAALAFYIIFSIAPTLLIAIAIAGSLFGRQVAEREILDRRRGAETAADARVPAGRRCASDDLAGESRAARRRTFRRRLGSMLLVIGAGVVVLISVVADAVIAVTGRYAAARLVGGELLWHAAQLIVSTLVLTALFAAVFRYLARVTWRDVGLGAAVTAILFVIGKFALGIYLGKAAVGSAFGAAGSIVVVLLWSYWSAQIFLLRPRAHARLRDRKVIGTPPALRL
jgi:membrane protein